MPLLFIVYITVCVGSLLRTQLAESLLMFGFLFSVDILCRKMHLHSL